MDRKCSYCGEPIDRDVYWEDDEGNFYCTERHLEAYADQLAALESSREPACSTHCLSKAEIIAACDRVSDYLNEVSDEELYAELSKIPDGPIAKALRGE